jgi:hypothetical protein
MHTPPTTTNAASSDVESVPDIRGAAASAEDAADDEFFEGLGLPDDPRAPTLGEFSAMSLGIARASPPVSTLPVKKEGVKPPLVSYSDSKVGIQDWNTSVVQGISVALIPNPDELCLGHIGSSKTKFCALSKGTCLYVTHRKSKEVVAPGLYILDKTPRNQKGICCLSAPFLAMSHLNEELIQDTLRENLTFEEVIAKFSLLRNMEVDTREDLKMTM